MLASRSSSPARRIWVGYLSVNEERLSPPRACSETHMMSSTCCGNVVAREPVVSFFQRLNTLSASAFDATMPFAISRRRANIGYLFWWPPCSHLMSRYWWRSPIPKCWDCCHCKSGYFTSVTRLFNNARATYRVNPCLAWNIRIALHHSIPLESDLWEIATPAGFIDL